MPAVARSSRAMSSATALQTPRAPSATRAGRWALAGGTVSLTGALLTGVLLAAPAPLGAAGLEVAVTDAAGQPLADAAVMVHVTALGAPAAVSAVMDQRDETFVPHVLTVPVGASVRIRNSDGTAHHIYAFSPAAPPVDVLLPPGDDSFDVTFGAPGVVPLGCNIHDDMLAYVVVADTPHVATTGPSGVVRLEGLPSGTAELRLWHPRQPDGRGFALTPALPPQPVTLVEGTPLRVDLRLPVPLAKRARRDSDRRAY